MASHDYRRLWLILSLVVTIALALIPGLAVAQGTTPSGTYYVVQRGDSWSMIAWRNGLTLSQLRAANPQYIRPGDVLWPGDRLFIPATAGAAGETDTTGTGYWYTVRRGDSWQAIARDAGVTVLDLWHANPGQANRAGSPFAGTRLWIPAPAPAAPAAAPTTALPIEAEAATAASPTEASTATTAAPTEVSVATTAAPSEAPTATQVAPTPTAAPPPVTPAGASNVSSSDCPEQFSDYPGAVTHYLNSANATADGLRLWLAGCRAISAQQGSVTEAKIQGPGSDDYLVVLADPTDAQPAPASRLLVYHSLPSGYVLAGIAQGQGKIAILRVADINADGKTDIVWTDTTCPGATCQSTLFVDSWDGTSYRSFIEGQPVTAAAEYSFQPIPGFPSQAIVIRSAVPGNSQPQSATYVPAAGGLYRALPGAVQIAPPVPTATAVLPATTATATPLAPAAIAPATTITPPAGSTVTAESASGLPTPTPAPAAGACLFDLIKSADQTFDNWPSAGFGPAIQAYQAAVDDTGSQACGTVKDELTLLRDFAHFRLMVALSGNGKIAQAPAVKDQITTPAIKAAGETFLSSYQDSHSLIQACRDTSTYAAAHPESWRFMVALGQADFTADDLCPLAK